MLATSGSAEKKNDKTNINRQNFTKNNKLPTGFCKLLSEKSGKSDVSSKDSKLGIDRGPGPWMPLFAPAGGVIKIGRSRGSTSNLFTAYSGV